MKTKTLDAVTEFRRWKAAVAEKTQAMSRAQVLAFFDKDKALTALAQMRQTAPQRAGAAV
jgi:hypothetical protein